MHHHVGIAERARRAAGSRTSPRRYSIFVQPYAAGSNGRRAMPTIRATRSSAWSSGIRPNPNVPVGPVTATVRSLCLPGSTPAARARAAGRLPSSDPLSDTVRVFQSRRSRQAGRPAGTGRERAAYGTDQMGNPASAAGATGRSDGRCAERGRHGQAEPTGRPVRRCGGRGSANVDGDRVDCGVRGPAARPTRRSWLSLPGVCRSCPATARSSARCRSGWAGRSGWTTRTSTSATTSGGPPCRRPAGIGSSPI